MKTHSATDLTQATVTRFLGSYEHHLSAVLDDHDLPVGFLLAYELMRAEITQPMMLLYETDVSERDRDGNANPSQGDMCKSQGLKDLGGNQQVKCCGAKSLPRHRSGPDQR